MIHDEDEDAQASSKPQPITRPEFEAKSTEPLGEFIGRSKEADIGESIPQPTTIAVVRVATQAHDELALSSSTVPSSFEAEAEGESAGEGEEEATLVVWPAPVPVAALPILPILPPLSKEHNIGGQYVMIMLKGNVSGLEATRQAQVLERFEFEYSQVPVSYPFWRYLELVEYLRTELYANLEPDEAYQKLGYGACLCYFDGLSGQVLKMAARVMGPVQGAKHFVRSMQVTLPWDTHQLLEARSGYICYSKTYSGVSPALVLGFLQASLEAAGVSNARLSYGVKAAALDPHKRLLAYHEAEWV